MTGVKVSVGNLATGAVRAVETTSSGDYVVNLLPPGKYSVRVERNGFKSFNVPSLDLAAGDRARVDATMQVGQVSERIEVQAQAPALQSDSSTVGDVVTQKAVQDLPLNGRNYVNLVQLAPGANPGPPNGITSGNRPDDRRQTSTVSVNGQSDLLNNHLIAGLDNNERIIGTIGVRPSNRRHRRD